MIIQIQGKVRTIFGSQVSPCLKKAKLILLFVPASAKSWDSNMELEQARFNMIEQQIRPWDVLDQNVLDLLKQLPRENFVPSAYRELSYADIIIPLDHGQVMMQPKIEARMLQALQIHPTDRILEIGTGSGYVTALLSKAGGHLLSIDIFSDFTKACEKQLNEFGITNVTLETGDAAHGWQSDELFDVIAITGSLPILPSGFQRMLNRGGRMFVVTGETPVMEAILIRRVGEYEWSRECLFETELPMLKNASRPSQFVF
jgi:protein-L-isoaspartate(D-aspartate) O-methyltransferase